MNKIIEIHDDWCDIKMFDHIEDFVLFNAGLEYNYRHDVTYDKVDPDFNFRPAFNSNIIPDKAGTLADATTTQILSRFCDYKNFELTKLIQSRSFIHLPNGKKSTRDGIHIDLSTPHFVLIYYINDSDGDTTLFKDDKKTEIKRIKPKKGRVAFFDGSIYHCSSTPVKSTRAIINFDFTYKNLNE